jgi:hypothetical protein
MFAGIKMEDFLKWFDSNYPHHSLSIESLEFIEADLKYIEKGDKHNIHWCYIYLNGDRQFVLGLPYKYTNSKGERNG